MNGRFRARRLMHKYNNTFPEDATVESLTAQRFELLKEMLGKVGEDSFIEPPFCVDYGCNIIVGDKFYANFGYVNSLYSVNSNQKLIELH